MEPAKPFSQLTEELTAISAEIADLNAQVKVLTEVKNALTEEVIDKLKSDGLKTITNSYGTFSLQKKTVPKVESWEEFYAYIRETDSFFLLERRPSAKACVEQAAIENTPGLPGVDLIDLSTLSVRNPK